MLWSACWCTFLIWLCDNKSRCVMDCIHPWRDFASYYVHALQIEQATGASVVRDERCFVNNGILEFLLTYPFFIVFCFTWDGQLTLPFSCKDRYCSTEHWKRKSTVDTIKVTDIKDWCEVNIPWSARYVSYSFVQAPKDLHCTLDIFHPVAIRDQPRGI